MTISMEGKDYELDVQRAKELNLLKLIVTYSHGQRFRIRNEIYILANLGWGKASLIGLRNGNRFSESVTVGDANKITESEMTALTLGNTFEIV